MKKKAISCLCLLSCAVSAPAAIDLTPIPSERVLAGIKFPMLNFRENGKVISYEPPRGWQHSGGAARLRLTPPNLAQAQGEIDQIALPEPQHFNEDVVKALQQKTLAMVPQGSVNATLVSEALDSFRVNNHPTYEAKVAYTAFGQEFMMSIIYVNLPDTQLRFRTLARKDDFEKVYGAFRASIFSWHWR